MPDRALDDVYLLPLPATKPRKDPLRRRVVGRTSPMLVGALRVNKEAAVELDALTSGWGCATCTPEKCTHNLEGDGDGME